MTRKEYNKLVRDRIPEIIRQSGRECETFIMNKSEYREALLNKLLEESQEIIDSPSEQLITELADLQEVIDAILKLENIECEQFRLKQASKRSDRGGFESRLKLMWSE